MKTFKQFLLLEAVDYKSMFNIVIKEPKENANEILHIIDSEIEWANEVLKKNYRIQWWLKWIRLGLLLVINSDDPKIKKEVDSYSDILDVPIAPEIMGIKPESNKLYLIALIQTYYNRVRIHSQLQHFYDLGIPEIDNFTYDNKITIKKLLSTFTEIEETWAESRQGSIPYIKQPLDASDDGIDEVMKFPDGYYWVDLHTNTCRLEADALGHCGTAGDRDSTLISLRYLEKPSKNINTWLWRPHVTFELTDKNDLTQMKGKQNNKPEAKYHKYILALLTLKVPMSTSSDEGFYINKIIGGGYKPETNFKVSDLTDDQQDQLYEIRPELMPINVYYRLNGINETLKEMVEDKCKTIGFGDGTFIWDENNLIKFDKWNDGQNFIDNCGNDNAKYVSDIILGDEYIDYSIYSNDIEEFFNNNFNSTSVEEYLKEKFPDFIEGEDDLFEFIVNNDDDFIDNIRNAIDTGYINGSEAYMLKDLESELQSIKVFADSHDELFKCNSTPYFEEPFYCCLPAKNVIEYISDDDICSAIEENGSLRFKVELDAPYNGYTDYDNKAAIAFIKEETNLKDLLKY